MAEFCLQCFKRFEPNANEYNTTLSTNLEWCEGCAELRQVVVDFVDFNDDDNEPMTECKHQDDKCEYWYMGMCELDDRLNVCPHSELYKQLQKFSGYMKNENNKQVTIQDNLTLYCPICKTPLYQYDKKIPNSTSAHVKGRCDNCGGNYHWMEYVNKISEHKVAGFSSFYKSEE